MAKRRQYEKKSAAKIARDARELSAAAAAFAVKIFNEEEAGQILHLQPGTLSTWRYRGKGLPFVRVGRRVFYLEKDLEDFLLKTRRVDPAAKAS